MKVNYKEREKLMPVRGTLSMESEKILNFQPNGILRTVINNILNGIESYMKYI